MFDEIDEYFDYTQSVVSQHVCVSLVGSLRHF